MTTFEFQFFYFFFIQISIKLYLFGQQPGAHCLSSHPNGTQLIILLKCYYIISIYTASNIIVVRLFKSAFIRTLTRLPIL